MFIANFLTGPGTQKTPVNISLTFMEYLHSKVNSVGFLENLSEKYRKDYLKSYYYGGTKYVSN